VPSSGDLLGDAGDLIRRFSLAEDDFREPLAELPVVVYPREPKVLERGLAYELKNPVLRISRVHRPLLDGLEECQELVGGHLYLLAIDVRRHG